MNIIHKVTWQSMWKNKTRTLVTIISVMLSAAMFMAVTSVVYSLWDYIQRSYTYQSGDYYVEFRYATDEQYEALKEDPDVSHVADFKMLGYHAFYRFIFDYKIDESGTMPLGAVDQAFLQHMAIPLVEGRLPENSSEILLPMDYYDRYEMNHLPTASVGDTITLKFLTYVSSEIAEREWNEDAYAEKLGIAYEEFEKTFTVVGVMENRGYDTESWSYYSPGLPILTISDGNEGEVLWHRLFVKTDSPDVAYDLAEKEYGGESYLNRRLLKVRGSAGTSEQDIMIAAIAVILITLVLIASISPIRNAFSIAVSERTTQFGLMNSIGTTKKQIRKSVWFETMVVALIGIPLGLLLGYGLFCWLIYQHGTQIISLYESFFSTGGGVPKLSVTPSRMFVVPTVLLCLFTVLISARKPARRATKITPLEAIRQQKEIKVRAGRMRVGKWTQKLFGLPGVLARKYYCTSRKKYRTTVFSIAVSLLLFIAVNYLADSFKLMISIESWIDNEISYVVVSREDIPAELAFAESVSGVTQVGVIHTRGKKSVNISNLSLADEYREIYSHQHNTQMTDDGWTMDSMYIYFLEDEDFVHYLTAEGIDPEPYLTAEEPLVVTISRSYTARAGADAQGNPIDKEYFGSKLKNGGAVYLRDNIGAIDFPNELVMLCEERWKGSEAIITEIMSESYISKQGENIIKITAGVGKDIEEFREAILGEFVVKNRMDTETKQLAFDYYEYDSETGRPGELVLTKMQEVEYIRIGESLKQCPFGVDDEQKGNVLLMPYSKMPKEWESEYRAEITMHTEDFIGSIADLRARAEVDENFDCGETEHEAYESYMVIDMAEAIINGLTLLISLMGAVNVFNTITANIALRRRDFGMLRSIGMTNRDINRMMSFECLSYGINSLLAGISFGLLGCGITYYCIYRYYKTGVGFPWETIGMGCVLVFLIVFASAFYAVAKMRRDNPIDAMRMDNL